MGAQAADALLYSITELGRRLFGAAACSLAVLEPDEAHLVFRAASGPGAAEVVGLRLPVSRGIAGWVVSSGQPIGVQNVRADPRWAQDVAESTGYVPRSMLAMPLNLSGEVNGVVEVLDRSDDENRDDMALLAVLADHAALAVGLLYGAGGRVGSAGAPPDPLGMQAALDGLDPAGRRAVGAVLTEVVAYLERRGGPARVE